MFVILNLYQKINQSIYFKKYIIYILDHFLNLLLHIISLQISELHINPLFHI
jgi:hypothetical protein